MVIDTTMHPREAREHAVRIWHAASIPASVQTARAGDSYTVWPPIKGSLNVMCLAVLIEPAALTFASADRQGRDQQPLMPRRLC